MPADPETATGLLHDAIEAHAPKPAAATGSPFLNKWLIIAEWTDPATGERYLTREWGTHTAAWDRDSLAYAHLHGDWSEETRE